MLVLVPVFVLLTKRVNTTVLAVGLVMAVWGLMGVSHVFDELVTGRSLKPPQKGVVRQKAELLTIWIAALLSVTFPAAPAYWAVRDAGAATTGRDVSGFPAVGRS